MRSIRRVLLLAAAACWVAPTAWAAVTNSHHDLSNYSGGTTEEVCYFCHGVTDTTAATTNYGNVGDLCVNRCHAGAGAADFANDAGTVIPQIPASISEAGAVVPSSSSVDAVNVASAYAHGLTKSNLLDPVDGSTTVTFDTIGLAFPYGAGAGDMECTTCHNVHDNTNTPFLQADLFTGGPGGTTSFCEACHTARGNTFNGAGGANTEATPNGEHPVDVSLTLTDVTARTLGGRAGRYIQIDTASGGENVFDVATPNGAALTGTPTATSTYATGGKVSGFGNAAAGDTMSCYTCHSPHMPATGGGTSNLVLRDTVSADGTWNPLCVSCHGQLAAGADNVEQNPGLSTSSFFHPVGPSAPAMVSAAGNVVTFNNSTGSFTFDVDLTGVVTYTAAGSLTTGGVGIDTTTYQPRCTSCHDAHGGAAGTMAIADIDGTNDGTLAGAVCYECHTGVGLPDVAEGATGYGGEVANVHHRTRVADAIGTGTITDTDGDTLTIDAASWQGAAATGDTFGNLADGLSCPDCHVFNGTAHNW